MNLNRFLKTANQEWAETVEKAKKGNFENPPDGAYIAELTSADLDESKNSGKIQIRWGYTFLEGDKAGTTKYEYLGLEGQRGLEPLVWRLSALGVDAAAIDLTQLETVLEELVERHLVMKITLKTPPNSDFQNLRIVKLLPNYNAEEDGEPAPTPRPDPAQSSSGATAQPSNQNGSAAAPATPSAPEEVELRKGMKAFFDLDGARTEGVVDSLDDDTEIALVKVPGANGKFVKHEVAYSDLEVEPEGLEVPAAA